MINNSLNVGEERGFRGEDGGTELEDVHRMASYLADRLGDAHSLAWYRKVAAGVSASVIHEALTQVLDVPADRIRKSRAAYFTALIRRHLPSRPTRQH